MNCSCGKPITSKVTGELCTSCFFNAKKNKTNETNTSVAIVSNSILPNASNESLDNGDNDSTKVVPPQVIQLDSTIDSENESIKHIPKQSKFKDPSKKYCQSCIERGYGLKEASREWNKDYFICDDCFNPLMNNLLSNNEQSEIERVKPVVMQDKTSPALDQFYQLLNIPPELRFSNSDNVINQRNDIQNHHATALVNMSDEEVIEQLEFYHVILFNIRYRTDENKARIDRIKAKAREEKNLLGFEKSKKETVKGKSKATLNAQESLAKRLFPDLSVTEAVRKMEEITKAAKLKEFETLTNKGK